MRRGLVLLLVLCGGCAGGDDPRSEPSSRVYELALHGTFERDGYLAQGTSILEIDPITLRPLVRRGHRLPAYANSSLFSPDRRELALGMNFGELAFVAPAPLRTIARMQLANDANAEVFAIGWPAADLLVAVVCTGTGKYGCLDQQLVLVDPERRRVRARIELDGAASWRLDRPGRRAVLLVTPGGESFAPPRLIVVSRDGTLRQRTLTGLHVGTATDRHVSAHRRADLALVGGRAIVVSPDDPVAEIDLATLLIRYHRVQGLDTDVKALHRATVTRWQGTANPSELRERHISTTGLLEPHLLVVSGSARELVGPSLFRSAELGSLVLDLRTWRTRPARTYELGQRVGGLMVRAVLRPQPGPKTLPEPVALVAYDRAGKVRWRERFRGAESGNWDAHEGRIYLSLINGRRVRVLDAATGRTLRPIRPRDVEFPLLRWPSPR